MAKKRKTLPNNFREIVQSKDLEKFIEIFDTTEINAFNDRFNKDNALFAYGLTDEMIQWFIKSGGDMELENHYKRTPLLEMSGRRYESVQVLLDLGANSEVKDSFQNTPLHLAAGSGFNSDNVRALLNHNADPFAQNTLNDSTPLEYALNHAQNIDLINLVEVSKILLEYQNINDKMKESVKKLGENFEFHRESFNQESVDDYSNALEELYRLFNITPVKKRILLNIGDTIELEAMSWQKQFDSLWEQLIPGSGHAASIQGEVIRICGKVNHEILDNGAINWSRDFKKLPQSIPTYISHGEPIDEDAEIKKLALSISANSDQEDLYRLSELVVKWIKLNPRLIKLESVTYDR